MFSSPPRGQKYLYKPSAFPQEMIIAYNPRIDFMCSVTSLKGELEGKLQSEPDKTLENYLKEEERVVKYTGFTEYFSPSEPPTGNRPEWARCNWKRVGLYRWKVVSVNATFSAVYDLLKERTSEEHALGVLGRRKPKTIKEKIMHCFTGEFPIKEGERWYKRWD